MLHSLVDSALSKKHEFSKKIFPRNFRKIQKSYIFAVQKFKITYNNNY